MKNTEFIPLAVVGLGGVFPKAKTLRQFWANIKNKVDAIEDVPASHWTKEDYFDADPKKQDKVYACKGGFLDAYDFDPSEFGLSPNTLEATDPAQLFALVAAKMALADAGYAVDKETWDRSRVSCILGVTGALEIVIPLGARLSLPAWRSAILAAGVAPARAEDALARMSDEFVPWQEASFPGLLGNVIAGRIANRFNLGGTNCVVDAACGSALSAMHMAALELQTGRAKMVVTGGVDTFNDIFMFTCFTKTPALSPSGHARPFDAKADGTTLGEGVGMIVLKRLDDAKKDGDVIHAILRGLGTSSDGRGKSIYAPSAGGQTRAIEEAYRLSGLSADTVELVEAHGTGTAVGDGIEVEAISGVYKRETKRNGAWCALGSVKSMIGHTKAASGAAAFVKAAMALRHKVLPPTLKVTEPLPILAGGETPFYLSLEKRPWMGSKDHPRRAACSALGFGGTNFHAILEEGNPTKSETDWDGEHEIVVAAANNLADITAATALWAVPKSWDQVRLDAVASRKAFNVNATIRMSLVLERGSDYVAVGKKAVELLSLHAGQTSWSSPEGIYFGSGKPGKLGVLFPGQGAQYVGMSRDLVCAFPSSFEALSEADAVFEGEARLSDLIFPRPAWKPEQKQAQEKLLRDTSVAQPALGAAALSAWRALAVFGVKADAAAGHSYGELTALHLAGRYDGVTLHVLSGLRGRLMKGDGCDKGAMLAVISSYDEVATAVSQEGLDLVIANRNAPMQNVLSGATAEIEKAEKVLSARGLKVVRLPVAAAFHSALVAPALQPFAAALEKAPFTQPSLPVYSNSTGEVYPESPAKARELLAWQLAKPVEFVKLIEAMRRDGVTTFIECGAGNRLTGLVGQILRGQEFVAVATDASNGKKNGIGDLAKALAQLVARGHEVDLTPWQNGESGLKDVRPKPKMSVPLTGATYRSTPRKNFPAPCVVSVMAPQAPVAPAAAQVGVAGGLLGQALSAAQAGIDALTKLQEQTASLHLQFLQGQDCAQRSVQALVEQQQSLYARMSAGASTDVPASIPVPAPASVSLVVTKPVSASGPAPVAVLPVLIAVVSEKTGYPAETIDPSMDLEADLGIDSIKRVEILSAVAERLPNCPKVKPEHLGTLRTLKQIAAYLSEGTAVCAPTPALPIVTLEEPCVITRLVPELVPVGPRDAFPLDKSLTVAVTKDSGLDAAVVRGLLAKGYKAELVCVDDLNSLPAELGALIVVAPGRPAAKGCPWTADSEIWLKNSFLLVQAAGRSFASRGARGLVMTVTRLDGALGLEGGQDQDPAFGGLSGLMKTAAREWPSVRCRAIDADPFLSLDAVANLLIKEMGFDGPVEAGLTEAGLRTATLVERSAAPSGRETLRPGDAVIVTGGARGVTAECALALAIAFKPRLVLIGRSLLPDAEPVEFAAAANESALRRLIAKTAVGLSPREIAARARDLAAAREIRATLSRLAACGATARYRAVDARDAAAVKALITETVKDFGPVRGIVHGAGVLADKSILDKTSAMLDAVLDTKLSGLRHLLDAVKPSDLRVLALFSSSTARYGRLGQSDYAVANEALNKAASVLAARLPECRVASFGWGPWDGGMVDASLKQLFASEGVGAIGLAAGGEHFIAELRGCGPAETVVLAALPGVKRGLPVSFERDLTLEAYPFLASHVLNGRAVLPLAVSAEWLAHAALHANPGFVFVGFDDLRVAKAVVVRPGAATTLKAHAGPAEKKYSGAFAVAVELRGAGGILHVSAKVFIAAKRPAAPAAALKVVGAPYARTIDNAYREVLFHGADMQFLMSVPHCGPDGIVVESKTALPPASWGWSPIRDRWLTDPAALDAAFQAMILWTDDQMGAPSLPSFVGRYRQYFERFPERGVRVVVKAVKRADGLAGADIEFLDERGALVARLEGFECAADASLAGAFRRNAVESVA